MADPNAHYPSALEDALQRIEALEFTVARQTAWLGELIEVIRKLTEVIKREG